MLQPHGIQITYIDATNPDQYLQSINDKTKVFYLESPANPTMKLVDISAVATIAKQNEITTVMDNTFATPFNQNPLQLGVDLVLHSATKYLGGHGDLLAGAVIGDEEMIHQIRWQTNKILGGVISPQTSWLVLRGIKTFAVRMERHNRNALIVAQFLAQHVKVKKVHYPGLPSHPQHKLAKRQMKGFSGMLAFDVGGLSEGKRLVNSLNLCTLAVSLGDVATLIQHSASMTHASVPRARRIAIGITDGLLRLSVGIEEAEDIIADLERGLKKI